MFKLGLTLVALVCLLGCATEFKAADGVNVPSNYQEAFTELDLIFTDQEKEALRSGETQVTEFILHFGMQLKEYWGLWKDSEMAKFMRKQEIEHPDHMITAIFASYVEYLQSN